MEYDRVVGGLNPSAREGVVWHDLSCGDRVSYAVGYNWDIINEIWEDSA